MYRSKRKVIYPVSAIDSGAINCIKNATNLLQSARVLLADGRKDHSFILYTFAVEEFGKALMLRESKRAKEVNGEKDVLDDSVTFGDHNAKIEKAEKHNGKLSIPMTDFSAFTDLRDLLDPSKNAEIQVWNIDERPINGKFLDFYNRLSILYVDYDEKGGGWKVPPCLPLAMDFDESFDALVGELENFII